MSVTAVDQPLRDRMRRYGRELPYTSPPYSSRRWGHPLHSLCSYQGKLKPGLVATLLDEIAGPDDTVLDPLGGVGTVAFEAALGGRAAWSNDLSPLAFLVARGKLAPPTLPEAEAAIDELADQLARVRLNEADRAAAEFGLNARVVDYFHPRTLADVLRARKLLRNDRDPSPTRAFVWACLLHVLHGNRPYALSRTSHPITPFSPRGPFVEKDLIHSLRAKARRALAVDLPPTFRPAASLHGDFRSLPTRLSTPVDVVLTSPPFLGMRFDRPNWLRLWFCGWDAAAFHQTRAEGFLERQQVRDRSCYRAFFQVCADVIKPSGTLVVHVGVGSKGDLGSDILRLAGDEFTLEADVEEHVTDLERHGLSDKRLTTRQHLLVFVRR